MNDPGLDKPISDDAKDVENQMGKQREEEDKEDEESYLEPRWIIIHLQHTILLI